MSLLPQNEVARNNSGVKGAFDYKPIFSQIKKHLKDSDYLIGNLETPIGGESLEYTKDNTVFNTPKEFVEAIKDAGFHFLSTSNNHCLDRGFEGLKNTLDCLDSLEVEHSGTYLTNEESNKIFIKDIKGVKIALLAYTYGTNSEWQNNVLSPDKQFTVDLFRHQDDFNNIKHPALITAIKSIIKNVLPQNIREKIKPIVIEDCVRKIDSRDAAYIDRLKDKIARAKEEADLVVMYMHTGGQYNSVVGDYTKTLTANLKDWGCDLIIGSHPHCVLPYEYIGDVFAAYSLGNFCFTPDFGYYYKGVFADFSVVVTVELSSENKTIEGISFFVTKVVTEKDGNSVVYHVGDLYKKINSKQQIQLLDDTCSVISRFVGKQINHIDIEKNSFNIKDF